MCSNTRKKKPLTSPPVFFLEMSLPLMHQIIRITSPLLFALALAAHVEQANINLPALQEFWAQPIVQCWVQGGITPKSHRPALLWGSEQPQAQLVTALQKLMFSSNRRLDCRCSVHSQGQETLSPCIREEKIGKGVYTWEISAGNSWG